MSSASFRKIRFLGPGRRLAASEGTKIAGGASQERGEKLKFPAIGQGEGFEMQSRLPPGPFQPVRKVAGILGLAWAGPKQASRSPGSTREALGRPRDAPGAAQK